MELNTKQLKTLKDLKKYKKIVDPQQIVEYCLFKLGLPKRDKRTQDAKSSRRYSRKHYEGIIEYLRS